MKSLMYQFPTQTTMMFSHLSSKQTKNVRQQCAYILLQELTLNSLFSCSGFSFEQGINSIHNI
jgi:hypothetical protein